MPLPHARVLLDTLAAFAGTLTGGYGIGDVLNDLACRIPEVMNVAGAGVTLVEGNKVHFVTAPSEAVVKVEDVQDRLQSGPCIVAATTGEPMLVDDLNDQAWVERWPDYVQQAQAAGLRAVAGIPMRGDGHVVGAINLYATTPRAWTEDDVRVAGVLADIATGYLLHASALQKQRRTTEQLQQALDTRIIIEQAKGTISARCGISIDEAFQQLRKYARDHNLRLHDVAASVVKHGLRP